MGLKLLRKRGCLIQQAPGHCVPFASINDPPTAAARHVYGSGAEVEGQPSGAEGGSIRTTPLFALSGLSNHAVSGPFLEGATGWTEGAASWC